MRLCIWVCLHAGPPASSSLRPPRPGVPARRPKWLEHHAQPHLLVPRICGEPRYCAGSEADEPKPEPGCDQSYDFSASEGCALRVESTATPAGLAGEAVAGLRAKSSAGMLLVKIRLRLGAAVAKTRVPCRDSPWLLPPSAFRSWRSLASSHRPSPNRASQFPHGGGGAEAHGERRGSADRRAARGASAAQGAAGTGRRGPPPKDAKKTASGLFTKVLTKGTGKDKPN